MLHKVAMQIMNRPWLIEPGTALELFSLWLKIMDGKMTWQEARGSSGEDDDSQQTSRDNLAKLFAKSDIVYAPADTWSAKSFSGFDGATIAVIPIEGPMMKEDMVQPNCRSL